MQQRKNTLLQKVKRYLMDNTYGKNLQFNKAVLGLIVSFGLTGSSVIAEAANSTIIKVNAGNTIVTNGNVHEIYADKVSLDGSVAINHFKEFKLSTNEIANMHFKSSLGIIEANNLLNFVDSKIDIAGTVNALKGGKIGGNLYFISPKGMLVGKTGVINAGSLNVFVPVEKDYDKLAKEGNLFNGNSMLNKVTKKEFAINPEGTIVIQGQINTTDGINLKANSVEMYGEPQAQASLKTGVVDFTDLVNIKDANGNVVVDAKLGNNLKATLAGNGDVIIDAAENNSRINLGQNVKIAAVGDVKGTANNIALAADVNADKNIEFVSVNAIANNGVLKSAKDTKLNAGSTLDNNGEIFAVNDVILNAGDTMRNNGVISATNNAEITAISGLDNNSSIDAGNNAKLFAGANINNNGTLSAGNDINIKSEADFSNNSIVDAGNNLEIKANNSMNLNGMLYAGEDMDLKAVNTMSINADVLATGSIAIAADSVRINADITADEDANLFAGKELFNNRFIEAGGNAVLASDGYLENNGEITASQNISLKAEGNLNNSGKLTSDGDIALNAGDSLTNNGEVDAKGEVALKANNGLTNNAKLKSSKDMSLISLVGYIINRASVISSKNITITAKKDVSIIGDVTANDSVALVSTFGNVNTGDTMQAFSVMSLNDTVEVNAYESVSLYNVAAKSSVSMLSSFGSVNVNNVNSQEGSVDVNARMGVAFNEVSAKTAVNMTSSAGNIKGNKVNAPETSLSVPAGQVIVDFIFGQGEDEPYNPPYIDRDYEIKRQLDEARIITAMYDNDTDKEKFGEMNLVYYNRYDLYELEPLQPPTVTENGTTIMAENNALQLSVAEAAEREESKKIEN